MRKFAAILLLLFVSAPFISAQKTRLGQVAEKPNPTNYTVKIHISASHIRHDCSGFGDNLSCGNKLYADATIDGKKIELSSTNVIFMEHIMLVAPGDYQAMSTKNSHNSEDTQFHQEYKVLLSDSVVWNCTVSGVSE